MNEYNLLSKLLNKTMKDKGVTYVSGNQLAKVYKSNYKRVSAIIKKNNKYDKKCDKNILNVKGYGYTTIDKGFKKSNKSEQQFIIDNLKAQLESRKADVRVLQQQIKNMEVVRK